MKIRGDFVTNSSSVSYILTMNEDIAESYRKYQGYKGKDLAIYNKLKEIAMSGDEVKLGGHKLYSKKIRFSTDECTIEYGLKCDYSQLTDEELLSYIYGAYLLEGKIAQFAGFGSTMVESY